MTLFFWGRGGDGKFCWWRFKRDPNSKVKWPPTGGLKGHKLNHRINTFRYIFSTASGSKSTVSFHVSKTMQRSDSCAVAAVIENKVLAAPTSLKSCSKATRITRTSRVQQKGPLSWGIFPIVSTSLLSSNLSNLPPDPDPVLFNCVSRDRSWLLFCSRT